MRNSTSSVGGICGINVGNIVNCNNYVTIGSKDFVEISGGHGRCYTGGICGRNEGNIDGCCNKGEITAYVYSFYESFGYAGGIAGYNKGKISNSSNTQNVYIQSNHSHSLYETYSRAGGISGSNEDGGVINKCYNTGYISADASAHNLYVGGICGYCYASSENVLISNCYNKGNLGPQYACTGGISSGVLIFKEKAVTIENCYNIGTEFENESSSLLDDGICVGYSSALVIKNCYYLKGTAEDAAGSGTMYTNVSAQEMNAFSDGSVCNLLNFESSAWTQDIGTDLYPLLVSCKENKDGQVYAFTLDSTSIAALGNSVQFSGKLVLDDNIDTSTVLLLDAVKNIQWATSDSEIIDASGITCTGVNSIDNRSAILMITATPKKEGTVTITGTTSNGFTASCVVTIENTLSIELPDKSVNKISDGDINISGKLVLPSSEASSDTLQTYVNSLACKSNDESIIKSKDIVCVGVNSLDNKSSELMITVQPLREGNATISITSADGKASAKCEIIIEPDLQVSKIDITDTATITCSVFISESDSDYLDDFMNKISVEVEGDSNAIPIITSKDIKVMEDGYWEDLIVKLSISDEKNEKENYKVIFTSENGQKVSETGELRGDRGFFKIKKDTNSFSHSAVGVKHDADSATKIGSHFVMAPEYFSRAISGLAWDDEVLILNEMNEGDWHGSCFGLSVSTILGYSGGFDVNRFGADDGKYYSLTETALSPQRSWGERSKQ